MRSTKSDEVEKEVCVWVRGYGYVYIIIETAAGDVTRRYLSPREFLVSPSARPHSGVLRSSITARLAGSSLCFSGLNGLAPAPRHGR